MGSFSSILSPVSLKYLSQNTAVDPDSYCILHNENFSFKILRIHENACHGISTIDLGSLLFAGLYAIKFCSIEYRDSVSLHRDMCLFAPAMTPWENIFMCTVS